MSSLAAVITVVILEDADVTRDGLLQHLLAPDICVLGASADPGSVLALVRQHGPQVAILDLRIYGDDQVGFTMARKIREIAPETCCIFFTELAGIENQLRADELGVAALVSKVPRGSDSQPIAEVVRRVAAAGPRLVAPPLATAPPAAPLDGENPLTPRQQETLYWVGEGLSTQEIAAEMVIQPSAVKKHLDQIFDRLPLLRRARWPAVEYARKRGWIAPAGSIRRVRTGAAAHSDEPRPE